jgi:hypothetical protein
MVGKAVATMVCLHREKRKVSGRGGDDKWEIYLVEGGQKNATHEARKDYP